jgi:hypothetical protein
MTKFSQDLVEGQHIGSRAPSFKYWGPPIAISLLVNSLVLGALGLVFFSVRHSENYEQEVNFQEHCVTC